VGEFVEGDEITWVEFFVTVKGTTSAFLGEEDAGRLCFDVIAHIPWERIIYLATTLPILRSEELCVQMCNLTYLYLKEVDLSEWFTEPAICEPHTFEDLLPRLWAISIHGPHLRDGDWTPLTSFLTRRAAIGKQITWLRLSDYPCMDEAVTEIFERAVKHFEDGCSDDDDY